jgi:hypothetical protein
MQAPVEKSEEAEHAAKADQFRNLKDLAQGRDGQGDDQEAQSPVASAVLDELKGIGNGIAAKERPDDGGERTEAEEEQNDFAPFAGEPFASEKGMHAAIAA